MTADSSSETPRGRRGLPGPWVLLALAVVVAAVVLAGWMAARRGASVLGQQPPLSWQEREQWPRRPVHETSLSASGVRQLITGDEWRELGLTLSPEQEQTIHELAELARRETFEEPATRERLEAAQAAHPDLFYATYLLGTWHRIHDNEQRADEFYERAFANAPGVLQQAYITGDYRLLSEMPVGRIEVICYRADGEHVDDSLRLVFPELVTDERGYIAVPVYAGVYSIAERDEPAGLSAHHKDPAVFQFPGRIGTLPAAAVERRP